MPHSFAVGDLSVTRIVEQERPFFPPMVFLPDLTPECLAENRSWLEPTALDTATGLIVLCIQSYVVRTPHHTVLIDTCVGNHKTMPERLDFWHQKTDTTYMDALAGAGLSVDDIDYVMCTHLHPDHVGWNTRLIDGRWVPTFPNARYVFSEKEFSFWNSRPPEERSNYMAESVLPIVEANRADLVAHDYALGDHIRLEPTPGHTPDHCAVHLASRGRAGVVTGDLIHSPLQLRYPELSARPDFDKAQSAVTRRKFLERHCDTDTLVCGTHFPSPSVGHVRRWDDGFRFDYLAG